MPFGGYKDFKTCTKQNMKKHNPAAYCGAIYNKLERPKKHKRTKKRGHA